MDAVREAYLLAFGRAPDERFPNELARRFLSRISGRADIPEDLQSQALLEIGCNLDLWLNLIGEARAQYNAMKALRGALTMPRLQLA